MRDIWPAYLHAIGEWAEPRGKLDDRVSECGRLTVYQMTSSLALTLLRKIVVRNKLGERGHTGNYKANTSIYGPILQRILLYYMKGADTRGVCSAREIDGACIGYNILVRNPPQKKGALVRFKRKWEVYIDYRARVTQNYKYRVDKKNQLDVTFYILYFSSNSYSTCFGQPCAHHQELTTA